MEKLEIKYKQREAKILNISYSFFQGTRSVVVYPAFTLCIAGIDTLSIVRQTSAKHFWKLIALNSKIRNLCSSGGRNCLQMDALFIVWWKGSCWRYIFVVFGSYRRAVAWRCCSLEHYPNGINRVASFQLILF